MRIVIDTNVIASAIFFGGRPRELLERLLLHQFDAYISEEILDEYSATIEYLCNRYPSRPVSVPLTQIAAACKMIELKTHVSVCRDPDDDKFINCAIDSQSLYIVSGDKDLLSIEEVQGIEIITVAEFYKRLIADK